MKTYTKPVVEVKEFGLTAAIADLDTWLADEGAALGVGLGVGPIVSYTFVS